MAIKRIKNGVTAPKGFTANGLYSGVKRSGRNDLALIYSEVPCVAAGAFTQNKVRASCVDVSEKRVKGGRSRAIVVNSGNANCMTGPQGLRDSLAMAAATAAALGIPEKDMCVASTGLIGKPLALSKIMDAIPALVAGLSTKGSTEAAKGILTTDRIAKEVAVEIVIGGRKIRIGAIAKGSGMIHPDMKTAGVKHATMLCFATTDAVIEPVALRAATSAAIENTFNMITVDGDTSTNDMVVTLANGMAGNRMIRARSKESHAFAEALESVFSVLAKLIVRDGEGATKFVTVSVAGAHTLSDARILARTVASSNLTKCAFFGSDPNWGRIAAAAGRSGARVDQSRMRIYIGRTLVVKKGVPTGADHKVLRRAFMKKEIAVRVDLGLGSHGATAYTCDFSYDYVRINSAYRT